MAPVAPGHGPLERTWSRDLAEPQRRLGDVISPSLAQTSITAEGGETDFSGHLAVSTRAISEPSAPSSLTPPKLLSPGSSVIILSVTPCSTPSSAPLSFTTKKVAKQCRLTTSPHPLFTPLHSGFRPYLSTKATILRVTWDLQMARSRRRFPASSPPKGHVRFSRTLWFLWFLAEDSVVGIVSVPPSYSLSNLCQAPAVKCGLDPI